MRVDCQPCFDWYLTTSLIVLFAVLIFDIVMKKKVIWIRIYEVVTHEYLLKTCIFTLIITSFSINEKLKYLNITPLYTWVHQKLSQKDELFCLKIFRTNYGHFYNVIFPKIKTKK